MKQLAIISGKGGTGKTVLTAVFAKLAKNKVIVDCDVDAADLYILLNPLILEHHNFICGKKAIIDNSLCNKCGLCIEKCRYEAISGEPYIIDSIACEGCGVCYRICERRAIKMEENKSGEWYISDTKYGIFLHAKLDIAEENSGKLVSLIKYNAKLIAEHIGCNLIIIDGPPGISCPVISSLSGVDLALIVTEPSLTGMHDMIRVLALTHHFGIKSFVLINKYDLNEHISKDIETYCSKKNINCIGKISFNPLVTEALANKKIIIEYTNKPIANEFINIWNIIESNL